MIPLQDATAIVRGEARRFRFNEFEDLCQDGWVILLEHNPSDPALARIILRRRLTNHNRSLSASKRGAGMAVGRMDAGWEDEIGEDTTADTIHNIAVSQLSAALNFKCSGSRQALHQSIARARARWERIKRPHDL